VEGVHSALPKPSSIVLYTVSDRNDLKKKNLSNTLPVYYRSNKKS